MIKKKILIVEDEVITAISLQHLLEHWGCGKCEKVSSGKEAIEKAETQNYDLALVDVRLPDMDGTDLLAKLKEPLRKTIKIMITGFPSLESGIKALDEGADAYLVKPVKPEELLMLIEEKMKGKEDSE